MVSAEVESFARTGGLGDVVLGLSRALAGMGVETVIATPLYGVTHVPNGAVRWTDTLHARTGWGRHDVRELGVIEARVGDPAVRVCLLEHGELFGRQGIYGDFAGTFGDNELRYATLSRGALALAERLWGVRDDEAPSFVIHAHDWHAALAVITARLTMGEAWRRVPSVFTIHNLAYQGVLGPEALDRLAIPRDAFNGGCLEQGGAVNLLKGAIALSNRVTTVSPTYAREIQAEGGANQLEGVLHARGSALVGIINGVDYGVWNPATDSALAARYDAEDTANKARCRGALQKELGLPFDAAVPIIVSIGRIVPQKGSDLLAAALPKLLRSTEAQFAIAGDGDDELVGQIAAAVQKSHGRAVFVRAASEAVVHRMLGGADFALIPSRFEPCGLVQMYAQRYGALPVARATGGLVDTIVDCDAKLETGSGFLFDEDRVDALVGATERAIGARSTAGWPALVRRVMRLDRGWERPARQYEQLFRALTGKPA